MIIIQKRIYQIIVRTIYMIDQNIILQEVVLTKHRSNLKPCAKASAAKEKKWNW